VHRLKDLRLFDAERKHRGGLSLRFRSAVVRQASSFPRAAARRRAAIMSWTRACAAIQPGGARAARLAARGEGKSLNKWIADTLADRLRERSAG